MNRKNISWACPRFWGNEQRYVADALQSGWVSDGPYVERLERNWADFCGTPYAVTASNGTAALHMAFLALGIGPGDEVIVPGFGFMAAAHITLHVGARPVFSEVNPETWCMTAQDAERCITPNTKAIIPIHTYGNICEMNPILDMASEHGLIVVEDAAEAIGSKYKGHMAGTLATAGIFSFHAAKTITTGEGGAVVTASSELRDRMKLFRSHGVSTRRYLPEVVGHNFRLSNIQAALGCAQLEHIDSIASRLNEIYILYKKLLETSVGITLQAFSKDTDPLVWAVAVKLDPSVYPQGRDMVMEQLAQAGIETRSGFYSANSMPYIYGALSMPTCNDIAQQVVCLPTHTMLTNEEIEYICDCLAALKR